ncbi:lipopolysaccharide biosynthesis protein [Telmatospirillum sp. J64-1]|uniref:lipopolysaccharide biosynthesis protein n=1 Tax=Telmatospirillum sp. J64-1 TaxID=2502183 RepID=UPI00115D8761|nr:lipopolysaccharide biosynthesis protein [Telmatospirillum sp. J64-1]
MSTGALVVRNVRRITGLFADPVRGLSLLEQGLLSATNFAVILTLARSFPEAHFGAFSFAYISYMFLLNLHRSIVVVPFVIHTADREELKREGRLWNSLNLLVMAACTLLLGLAAATVMPLGGREWMAQALVAAMVFVPAGFLYEFLRRWIIQLHDPVRVVMAAVAYCAVYVLGLVWAIHTHAVFWAFAGFAAANLAAALVCLPKVLASRKGAPKPRSFRAFLAELGSYLSWSMLSNLAYNGYNHLPPLILGFLAGPVPVAAYQAMRNFTQPVMTLGTAIDNFDKPRAAREMARNGLPGMKRQLRATTAALFAMAGPYILLMLFFAPQAEALVYGERYADYAYLMYFWIAFAVMNLAVYPFETGLFLVKRPDLLFKGRIIGAVLCTIATLILVPKMGVAGAMTGLLLGWVVSGLFAVFLLAKVTRCQAPN